MGSTASYGFPYADLTDPPNGPGQQQALAEAVDSEIQRVDGDIAGVQGKLPTLVAVVGTYSGDGATTQRISVPELADVKFVIHVQNTLNDPAGYFYCLGPFSGGWGMELQGGAAGIESRSGDPDGDGFVVGNVSGKGSNMNLAGEIYNFIAWGTPA